MPLRHPPCTLTDVRCFRWRLPVSLVAALLFLFSSSVLHSQATNPDHQVFISQSEHPPERAESLARFYAARDQQPIWIEGDRLRPESAAVVRLLRVADEEGLKPQRYLGLLPANRPDEENLMRWEVGLTAAFVAYVSDMTGGEFRLVDLAAFWYQRPPSVDPYAVLENAAAMKRLIESLQALAPRHPQYTALKASLRHLRSTKGQEDRIPQLTLALERWRWLPANLGERYIVANIPTYELHAIDHGRVAQKMRIITGKEENPTPVFSRNITQIVFSPYWNVPPNIAVSETIPAVLRNPSYLRRERLEMIDGDRVVRPARLTRAVLERVQFRQRPGASNALGLVKFLLPNPYHVYLHDTPTDRLFLRARRAFSHGCVRVERPLALAQFVLAGEAEWSKPRIQSAMYAGKESWLKLKRPLPVYITYQTAWADEDGTVRFAPDVYGHDSIQLRLLEKVVAANP